MSVRPTLPNVLTGVRIVLIPVFVIAFLVPVWGPPAAALLFAVAGATDWADGYLARRLGQTSAFGAFLDPVADKLVVSVALVLLVSRDASLGMLIPACVIIGREIAISALREWLAGTAAHRRVAVSLLGKVKTASQFAALFLLLWAGGEPAGPLYLPGLVLLWAAMALTFVSMAFYLRLALRAAVPGPK